MADCTVRFEVEIRKETSPGKSVEVSLLMIHAVGTGWCKFISKAFLDGIGVNEIFSSFVTYCREHCELQSFDPVFDRCEFVWRDGKESTDPHDILKVIFYIHPHSRIKTRSEVLM